MFSLIITLLLNSGIIFSPADFDPGNYNQIDNTYKEHIIITDDIAI